jgi:ATP-dependent DNA helicase RecG
MQRAQFKLKADRAPDTLVMTATPIPRTLGLTVYGDLDVSVINELPPGRKPVATTVMSESSRSRAYEIVRHALALQRQVFIIYPLVEESEKMDLKDATRMAAHLQHDVFTEHRVGLIHGKMDRAQKADVMKAFQAGQIHILVATTVVEVGIDIPNASIMIIEHAERFGLSQLHQLRGRIGRGAHEAACILLAQHTSAHDALRRLKVMEKTNDGFKIAEEDFNIRGPGEFLGTRQSGLPDFRVAHIGRDIQALVQARTAAFELIDRDPLLEHPGHALLKSIIFRHWSSRFNLAEIG